MKASIGVHWIFEYTPLHLPDWAGRGQLITPLLFLVVGGPLLIWYKLAVALRRRMACSRVRMIRNLADCEALMVGYCRRSDGITKFERIMTFGHLLELSPEAARAEIRSTLLSLLGNEPLDTGESIDELLQPVFTFVESRRSAVRWTRQPAARS